MTNTAQGELETSLYFPTPLYSITRNDFIPTVTTVFDEYIAKSIENTPINDLHPSVMTYDMSQDERLKDFNSYILGTAYNILVSQGHRMDNQVPFFHSIWGQEHHKTSDMPEHIHNEGVQIIGFYFINAPDGSSPMIVHDPRYGKRQINLPAIKPEEISFASSSIVFTPKQGMFIFANSWLPHSFGRHNSDKPFKFIHFNIGLQQFNPQCDAPTVI